MTGYNTWIFLNPWKSIQKVEQKERDDDKYYTMVKSTRFMSNEKSADATFNMKKGDEGSIPFVNKGSHKGSIQILRNNWRKHVWWWVSFVSMRKGSITDRWMDIISFLKIEGTHKEEDYESTSSLFLFRMKEQHACKHKRVFMIIPHREKTKQERC